MKEIKRQPKIQISVVIPSHNCLAYLPFALASIRLQQRDDLEILIVDDGSSDGSWKWLTMRAREMPALRIFRLTGVGPAAARNHCIAEARGTYIAFLDADDRWVAHKLAAQLRFHRQHPEVALSFTNYRHIGPRGEDLGTCFDYWPGFKKVADGGQGYRRLECAFNHLFAENVVGTSTVMVLRNALQNANGFDTTFHSAEDWDLWLRLAQQSPFGFTEAVTTDYLQRPGSETSQSMARLTAMSLIYQRHGEAAELSGRVKRMARSRLAVAEAEHWQAQGCVWQALWQHLTAWGLAPSWRIFCAALGDLRRFFPCCQAHFL